MLADVGAVLSAIGLAALGFVVVVVVCVVVLRLLTVVLPRQPAESADPEAEPTEQETPGDAV
ncbi:MAG TPA: hypothetical protein VNY76_11395 [Candidatus Acidoferrales bacterium]|jgi:hypothetical protein|nr:hypothetical protein [Candidatus Acidoferrales bacterium]